MNKLRHLPGTHIIKSELRIGFGVSSKLLVKLNHLLTQKNIDVAILATMGMKFDEEPIWSTGHVHTASQPGLKA